MKYASKMCIIEKTAKGAHSPTVNSFIIWLIKMEECKQVFTQVLY